MFCYIKEWPNKMATLMTVDGVVLYTFNSIDEAQTVWRAWHCQQKNPAQSAYRAATAPKMKTPDTELEIIPCTTTFSGWLNNVFATCFAEKKVTG